MEVFATADCSGEKVTLSNSVCLPKTFVPRSARINNPGNKTLHVRMLSTCGDEAGATALDFKTWTFNVTLPPKAKQQIVQEPTATSSLNMRFSADPKAKEGVSYVVQNETAKAGPAPPPGVTSTSTVDAWAPGSCIPIDTSDSHYTADTVIPKEFIQPNTKRFDFGSKCQDCEGKNCSSQNKLLGDGTCNNGTTSTNSTNSTNATEFNFNCLKYEFDRGDCPQHYQFVPRMLVIQNPDVPALAPDASICASYGETCFCNGRVRFGNGKAWTMWRSMNESGVGHFSCTEKSFDFAKKDLLAKLVRRPLGAMPPHTNENPKICQCQTPKPVAPCARDGEKCFCNGKIQYFTSKSVSEFVNSNVSKSCTNSSFKYVLGRSDPEPGHCACMPKSCKRSADCNGAYWCQTNEGVTLSDGATCESGSACYCTGLKTDMPNATDFRLQLKKFAYPEANLGQECDKQCLKVSIKAQTNKTSSDELKKMATLISYSSRLFSQKTDINLVSAANLTVELYERDNVTQSRRLAAQRGQSLDHE